MTVHGLRRSHQGVVALQREMEVVDRVIHQWELVDPIEAANWRTLMRAKTEMHELTGGWTPIRELLAGADWPSYVQFMVARGLIKLGWDRDRARAWDRSDDMRDDSELFKRACRQLLPESVTTRKEQRKLFHQGVVLP